MAKSVQEKIVETHTLKVTGIVNAENLTIDTEDASVVFVQDSLKKFDGKMVVMTCQAKRELEPEDDMFEDESFM